MYTTYAPQASPSTALALLEKFSGVGVRIHLDGVPLAGDVAATQPFVVRGDLGAHPLPGGQTAHPGDQVGHPVRLLLGQRHHRTERLDQPDEEEARVINRDDAAVEVDMVVLARVQATPGQEPVVEEREGDPVAGAVDHHVSRHLGAIGETHRRSFEPTDRRLHAEITMTQTGQQVAAHRGVRMEHGMIGLRQPVVGDLPHRQPQHRSHPPRLQEKRPTRQRRVGQVVGGHAEQELREDVGPAAHRQVRRTRDPGGLHGDVGRRVADPQHHHPLAGEHLGRAVVVGMQLLARELARERRLRPARVPVVAVGDDHVVVVPRPDLVVVSGARGDVVARALGRHARHLGPEGDPRPQPEVVDELVEVRRDLPMARVVGKVGRHRVGGVLHRIARGVDVQRLVRRRHAVVVVVAPVAADPRAEFEAVEVDASGRQHLRRGDSRRARSDDADLHGFSCQHGRVQRIACDDDLLALMELERAANLVALAHVYPPWLYPYPADDVLARWRIVLDDPDCTTLVLNGATGLVGLVAHDGSSVRHLAVHPELWGTGLARTLLGAACDAIEGPVFLWCLAENHRARGLYEHLGWQPTGVAEQSEFPPHPTQLEYVLDPLPAATGPALSSGRT